MPSEPAPRPVPPGRYVHTVVGGLAGLAADEGLFALGVFGVAVPLAVGLGWALTLWLFAPCAVWLLMLALVGGLLAMDGWLMYKAGWFDAAAGLVVPPLSRALNSSGVAAESLAAYAPAAAGPGVFHNVSSFGDLTELALSDERVWYIL